ncbi:MAG: hypothetical protein AB7U85_07420 [Alphaproteobacteria bacterium]
MNSRVIFLFLLVAICGFIGYTTAKHNNQNASTFNSYQWDNEITQFQMAKIANTDDKIIFIDFNNDGKEELLHIIKLNNKNERLGYVYFDNIDEVKNYLKQSSLTINSEKDLNGIASKFNGRKIKNAYFPSYSIEKKELSLPLNSEFNFFQFNNQNYIINEQKVSYTYLIDNYNRLYNLCIFDNCYKKIKKGKDSALCDAIINNIQ